MKRRLFTILSVVSLALFPICYFLASEAGGSPPIGRPKADLGGSDPTSTGAEKIAQFLPSDFIPGHIDHEAEI